MVETVKATYDAYPETRFILLGSSQILLLSKVRESLAGRAAIEELWPLTLPERMTRSWDDPCHESRLVQWLRTTGSFEIFHGVPATSPWFASTQRHFDNFLDYGGMPAITDPELRDDERTSAQRLSAHLPRTRRHRPRLASRPRALRRCTKSSRVAHRTHRQLQRPRAFGRHCPGNGATLPAISRAQLSSGRARSVSSECGETSLQGTQNPFPRFRYPPCTPESLG